MTPQLLTNGKPTIHHTANQRIRTLLPFDQSPLGTFYSNRMIELKHDE